MNFYKSKKGKDEVSYSTGGRRLPKLPPSPLNGRPHLPVVRPAGPRLGRRTLLTGLAVLAAGFGGGWAGAALQRQAEPASLSSTQRQQIVSSESELIADIAGEVGPSVVSINVTSEVPVQGFFGPPRLQPQESAGTGFIVSASGVIVTNRHVVPAGTTEVSVTLADGTTFDDVQVIGRTSPVSSLDIAFLKIKDAAGKKLAAARLGDSSKVEVGDRVVAIGNALGQFQNSVTSGIISGYGRDVQALDSSGEAENLTDLFQTDAAINEGNSGGPLVNMSGEVIGINTAVAGGAQNIGFAIPVNDIKGLVAGVLESGELRQPYLGVRYISLNDAAAGSFDLEVKRGAYLAPGGADPSVLPDSPAAKAGLAEGDIITKVNGIELDENTSLGNALGRFQVDDRVTLTVIRDGKTIRLQITLEATPQD